MHIVHICPADKFTPGFIEFIRQNFDFSEHQFWIYGDFSQYGIAEEKNVFRLSGIKCRGRLLWSLLRCRKVMLHSFHGIKQALLLLLNPWTLRKSYWFIWGGDLYPYQSGRKNLKGYLTEWLRKCAIRHMAGIVTYIRGDFLNACRQYGCTGEWFECLMYTSNVFIPESGNDEAADHPRALRILVGNSALPTNNHLAAFNILHQYAGENIGIICPLSYGIPEYRLQVQSAGKQLFGERFHSLTQFMPARDYRTLLRSIDIAVFNHTRQQAMGNTIALLGAGKTVFLNQGTTQWDFFREKGIHVCDLQSFSLTLLSEAEKMENQEKIAGYFSEDNLYQQLNTLFNEK